MSIIERKIAWKEKNKMLHQKLKNSWMPKTISAFCRSSVLGVFQIKNMDTPISKYKVVQTGPNKYAGGLNDGLFKVANHSGIAFAVSRPAVKPRPKGSISETKSLKSLALSIFSILYQSDFYLFLNV